MVALVVTLSGAGLVIQGKESRIADLEEEITTITDEGDVRIADLEDKIATITAEGAIRNADLETEVDALEAENADIEETLANVLMHLPPQCRTESGKIVRSVVGLGTDKGPRGLGVVLSGYILTAEHLVEYVDTIDVIGWSKSEEYVWETFDVVYRSVVYDFALLEPARGEPMPFTVDAINFLYEGDLLKEQAGNPVCHFGLAGRGDGYKKAYPAFGAWRLMSVAGFADVYEEYAELTAPQLREQEAFALADALEENVRELSGGENLGYRFDGAFLSKFVIKGASGSPMFVRDSGSDHLKMAGILSSVLYFDLLYQEDIKGVLFTTIEQICEDASEAGIDLCGASAAGQ